MQGAKALRAIAPSCGITNDGAFGRVSCFDLQPGVAAFAGFIMTSSEFSHDAFQVHCFYRFEKSVAVIHGFTETIIGIRSDRVLKPLTPADQRLIDDRAAVE